MCELADHVCKDKYSTSIVIHFQRPSSIMSAIYEKGVLIPTGGSLGTRDLCMSGRDFDPYLNRAFMPTNTRPFMGKGPEGIERIVALDTDLTYPYYNRVKKGCSNEIEYDVGLTFDFLPHKWQQDDFRPIHFMEDTRLAAKDACRTRPCAGGGNRYSQCLHENDPNYWQDDGCNSIERIFDDRPLQV